ncbi:MAG: hypothetical protein JWM41_2891 [Gemmatimonadetes bacterium]|nr:hypothetical protein [Gemmatimonadota bacterium]
MKDDDKPDDTPVTPITEYRPKTRKSHTPKSRRNQEAAENSRSPTVAQVREWIVAGVLAAGKKTYDELSAEHGRVFEVQESAFMAIVEGLHARLCVLEEAHGIASPDVASLRETLNAIAERMGDEDRPSAVPVGPAQEVRDEAGQVIAVAREYAAEGTYPVDEARERRSDPTTQ